MSERNGVPDRHRRRPAPANAIAQAVAPGPVVAGVVDLVEDDEPAVGRAGASASGLEATCW